MHRKPVVEQEVEPGSPSGGLTTVHSEGCCWNFGGFVDRWGQNERRGS